MAKPLCAVLAFVVAASWTGLARAQNLDFGVEPNLPRFAWTGTSNLGPITSADPTLALTGRYVLETDTSGPQTQQVRFVGSQLALSDIAGMLTPGPGTIRIESAVVTATSPVFTLEPIGPFTVDVTLAFSAGTMLIDPPGGNPVQLPLAGTRIDTVTLDGHATYNGIATHLIMHTDEFQFDIDFDEQGWTGTLTAQGFLTGVLNCQAPPEVYCPPTPNSAGPGATIFAFAGTGGSPSVLFNDLRLFVEGAPPFKSGLVLQGTGRQQTPFGNGNLCVGAPFFRLGGGTTDAQGELVFAVDLTAPPTPAARVYPGQDWTYQFAFRDQPGGGAGFNLTNATEVSFCP